MELTGEFVEHALYGEQFKVQSYSFLAMDDAVSIQRYLSSGAIRESVKRWPPES